jgi:hypothetical protein
MWLRSFLNTSKAEDLRRFLGVLGTNVQRRMKWNGRWLATGAAGKKILMGSDSGTSVGRANIAGGSIGSNINMRRLSELDSWIGETACASYGLIHFSPESLYLTVTRHDFVG